MQHQALYRKWRPQTFDDVCGQEHITSVLKYETAHGAFSHAYLFCGSRGTGKTTCAKILSRAVNCLSPDEAGNPCGECEACRAILSSTTTDVIEMDAASNNGVDNIRDIRDEVIYAPSSQKYRVYIIDEVHMLSSSAFNALLKTLEEPPAHVVFILATTELHKLPATIISRCQRFDFRRISVPVLTSRIEYIAEQEGIEIEHDAATLIAKQAAGGMRDAISLLELCAGNRQKITVELVNSSVGSVGRGETSSLVSAIADKDYDAIFAKVESVTSSAMDISVFWQDLISLYRDMLVVKISSKPAEYLDLTDNELATLRALADRFSRQTLMYHIQVLSDAFALMQKANAVKRLVAETALIKLCDERLDSSPEALLSRISALEDRINSVSFVSATSSVPAESAPKAQKAPKESKKAEVESSAPKKEESPARPEKASSAAKPMRSFSDVVERVARQDAMTASFIRGAKAYIEGEDKVIIRVDKEFSLNMLDRGNSKEIIRGALSAELGRNVADASIKYEVVPKEPDEISALDEIADLFNN